MSNFARKLLAAPVLAVVAVASMAGAAFAATPDPVQTGFTTLQTNLTTYLGYAAVLVVAIAGISIGIVMLVRWAKRAAKA